MIVPFTAGSTTDIVARAITQKIGRSLGQVLVIDNRGGASGTIGAAAAASVAPDGYTIRIQSSSHTVNPSTFAKLPFDTLKDFTAVAPIAPLPNALVISPKKNIKTLQALLDKGRHEPGKLNYASAGQGSATHLNAEKFRMTAKLDASNIPFKGSAEAINEILAGRADYYFSPIAPVISQIKEGHLLALAVGSGKSSAALPNVPTTAEAGVANSEFNFWIGMFASSKVPKEIVERLNKEVLSALSDPEVKQRFASLGAEPWALSSSEFNAYINSEMKSNAALVKAAGLSP